MFSFFLKRKFLSVLLLLFIIGFLLPQKLVIPVEGATSKNWNPQSFWYYPWGTSGTHKGIDIFAAEGTPVRSASYGIVVYAGILSKGGNVVLVLGPKWRVHYYAHLKSYDVHVFSFVRTGEKIGEVGTTGNAAGKSPHLHYAITTLFPYVWRIDGDHQGWKKMWYLDPGEQLLK